jgi:hypothetical protein
MEEMLMGRRQDNDLSEYVEDSLQSEELPNDSRFIKRKREQYNVDSEIKELHKLKYPNDPISDSISDKISSWKK